MHEQDVASVFGIELDEAAATVPAPRARSTRRKPAGGAKKTVAKKKVAKPAPRAARRKTGRTRGSA